VGVAGNAGGQAHGRVGGGGVHGTESSPGQGQKEPIAQGRQSFVSGLTVKLLTGTGTGTGKQYCRTKTWWTDAWPRIGHDPAEPSEIAEETLLPMTQRPPPHTALPHGSCRSRKESFSPHCPDSNRCFDTHCTG
jgi:hypothetical protein